MLHHKSKGLAYSSWVANGKRQWVYFGEWGSEEAKENYRRFCATWSASSASIAQPVASPRRLFIAEFVDAWLDHCRVKYVKFDRQTSEYHIQRSALSFLVSLYGSEFVHDFTLMKLETVRNAMIKEQFVRKTINGYVSRIIMSFRWGVGRKFVPPSVLHECENIEHLKSGRVNVPESKKVTSAPIKLVRLVQDHFRKSESTAMLADMIELQLLTGMRPGDVCGMKFEDIDQSDDVWVYRVRDDVNKTAHMDKGRTVMLGPKAQAVLGKNWKTKGFVFTLSGGDRPVKVSRYGFRIRQACDELQISRWHPHQLRHNYATEVKRRYESDRVAATAIGDSEEVTRRVYLDEDHTVAKRVAAEMG
jgi:integrase